MPDNNINDKNTYSTGELTALCGVTVRVVQYYDEKGLLPPSELTEGGRCANTDADAAKLRRIVLLKSLGLRLADIRDFLASNASTTVLHDVLEEQDRQELEERAEARRHIAAMTKSFDRTGELLAVTIPDMEEPMQKVSMRESELWPFYKRLIAIGIPIDIAEVADIAWWITTGDWRPFHVVMALVVAYCILIVRIYCGKTAYICPHCRSVFVPEAVSWFFARHTSTTRKVMCTRYGTKDWRAKVSSRRLAR